MKSEHRHQLETNDLSAGLATWIEKLKPYSGQLGTAVLLLALAYAGLSVWNSQTAQREQDAWDAFALASDTSDPLLSSIQQVASNTEYAGTKMQEWAYVGWADRQVLTAMQNYLIDRDRTEELLTNVLGVYEKLASSAADPKVMNRARFGLGRVYELQNKVEKAQQQYLRVGGGLKQQAFERAEQLDSEEVKAATTWLATAELPKRDLTGGQGASGLRPGFEAGLPATTTPQKSGISSESLDALLNEISNDSPSENRYGENDSQETHPATEEATTDESKSAESESTESESTEEKSEERTESEVSQE